MHIFVGQVLLAVFVTIKIYKTFLVGEPLKKIKTVHDSRMILYKALIVIVVLVTVAREGTSLDGHQQTHR